MSKKFSEIAKENNLEWKELKERVGGRLSFELPAHSKIATDDQVAEIRAALRVHADADKGADKGGAGVKVRRRKADGQDAAEAPQAAPAAPGVLSRGAASPSLVRPAPAAAPAPEPVAEPAPAAPVEVAAAPAPGVKTRTKIVTTHVPVAAGGPSPKAAPAPVAPAAPRVVAAAPVAPAAPLVVEPPRAEAPNLHQNPPGVLTRRRMETVVTRPAESLAPQAPRHDESASAPAPVVPEPVFEPAEAERPRASRFSTVVTRDAAPPSAPPEMIERTAGALGTDAEPRRSKFATVVTAGHESVRPRATNEELARLASNEPVVVRAGARIVGNVNPELLTNRLEADKKDFGPGPKNRPMVGGVEESADKKKGGKRVVQSRDLYDKSKRGAAGKKKGGMPNVKGGPASPQKVQSVAAEHKRVVRMEETILVSELASQMSVKAGQLVMKLAFELGVKGANINTTVDHDTAQLLADMFGFRVEQVGFDITKYLPKIVENPADFVHRPPVVTIMGHVDHGKTSLLDAIRSSRVAQGEAGGITQHIGAYMVETSRGAVCFLDTPGHEAFSALRARGALATDIVVLVVAADDGVMPQTVEAISHAKSAGVPIIVAVNKIDKPGANLERVRNALTEYELVAEEWGGSTIFCPVSALTRQGLDNLLEMIALQSEVLELTANPKRPAEGLIIESKLDVGRGPVATVLVQAGTLKNGDIVVVGEHFGRVRTMIDERGQTKSNALPSTPVEVTGLNGVPPAGERFYVVDDADAAKSIAEHVAVQNRQSERATSVAATGGADAVGNFMRSEEVKELKIVVKADVQGSVEALKMSLQRLSTDKVTVKVIHAAVGSITESDVNLAAAREEGVRVAVIGFNVRPEHRSVNLAEQLGVKILTESIIYEIINKVKILMTSLLEPVFVDETVGKAEVRKLFPIGKVGMIAGCMVVDGQILRNGHARVLRNGVEVSKTLMASLRHFDKSVAEVKQGFECGIALQNFIDLREGDIIECFVVKESAATL